MKLEIFDVEHGQCALLTHDNGGRIMIDCGHNSTTGWTPGRHLQNLGVTNLTKLVITNYDEDHVSGLIDLEKRVYIEWLLRNQSVNASTIKALKSDTGMGANIEYLAQRFSNFVPSSQTFPALPGIWEGVWCNNYPTFDDENNLSLAYALRVHNQMFIFPGDLECAGWERLLRDQAGLRDAVAVCDVLVASHHGRESGICEAMFNDYGCNPQLIVISDDVHQYDTQQKTGYYGSKCRGAPFRGSRRRVLTTRTDGKIQFSWSPDGSSCVAS
jgi:beta-lactamase superfamily II metal-dependent hydrolase